MAEFSVSEKNRQELLKIARQSIADYLKTEKLTDFNVTDPALKTPAAVFVTLTVHGNLRGCIGTTDAREPLFEAVSHMAVAAAVEDYRFPPVTLDELNTIRLEISVLSPMEPVQSADEIKQNVHGVVVKRDGRAGLFLPQVWEHFTSKDEFMDELCSQKAGLEPDAWKEPGTGLYVFTVFAFEEK
jgi:AmmeMemoRadiSam system protein A